MAFKKNKTLSGVTSNTVSSTASNIILSTILATTLLTLSISAMAMENMVTEQSCEPNEKGCEVGENNINNKSSLKDKTHKKTKKVRFSDEVTVHGPKSYTIDENSECLKEETEQVQNIIKAIAKNHIVHDYMVCGDGKSLFVIYDNKNNGILINLETNLTVRVFNNVEKCDRFEGNNRFLRVFYNCCNDNNDDSDYNGDNGDNNFDVIDVETGETIKLDSNNKPESKNSASFSLEKLKRAVLGLLKENPEAFTTAELVMMQKLFQ